MAAMFAAAHTPVFMIAISAVSAGCVQVKERRSMLKEKKT
ncbi:hypothetical protein L195_g035657, partial [Trifolium pratense]